MKQPVMDSVIIDFGPPTTQAVKHSQAFWDRLNAEAKAARTPQEKQAAAEKIWDAATKRTGPGEPWPFPDSGYDPARKAPGAEKLCPPGAWGAPAAVRESRQGDPEPWPKAPQEAPNNTPEPKQDKGGWTTEIPKDKPNVPPPGTWK